MPPGNGTVTITVLGSGTSVGVPSIGCRCEVCTSADPRDKRLRPSVLIRCGDRNILIDTSPDLRQQSLRYNIERIDAILYTHAHADHILGLDDVRPFNFHQNSPIPIYCSGETLATIQRMFRYIFTSDQTQSSRPKIEAHTITGEAFELFGIKIIPIPLEHGRGHCYGFRFGRAAYLTDHSEIPEASKQQLNNLDVLFLDALRHRPHPTHTTVGRALEYVEELKPKLAVFTHICHELSHQKTESQLPAHVRLAYDGMEIQVEMME